METGAAAPTSQKETRGFILGAPSLDWLETCPFPCEVAFLSWGHTSTKTY